MWYTDILSLVLLWKLSGAEWSIPHERWLQHSGGKRASLWNCGYGRIWAIPSTPLHKIPRFLPAQISMPRDRGHATSDILMTGLSPKQWQRKLQAVTWASRQHPSHCSHCSQLLKVLPKGESLMQVAHSRWALGTSHLEAAHLMILPASVDHTMFWKERVTVCLISGFLEHLRQ